MTESHIDIITHNGTFHTDEVMAYAMLNYLFEDNSLIRTRDMHIIHNTSANANNTIVIVIDVGGVYDAHKNLFDHHQESFNETFNETSDIPLSSAGLIYKHFGKFIIRKFYNFSNIGDVGNSINDIIKITKMVNKIYDSLYFKFIISIDAHDNGVPFLKNNTAKNYNAEITLGNTISLLNNIDDNNHDLQMESFKVASKLAWQVFSIHMKNHIDVLELYIKDVITIERCMKARYNVDDTGEILVIDEDCFNYRKCILEYEKDNFIPNMIKFIIYPKSDGGWSLRTMSCNFKNRVDIKNILLDGIEFIHKNLFIAKAVDKAAAIKLAKASL